MIDRYVVIATPRYADFKAFQFAPETYRDGHKKVEDGTPEFLARALDGGRTRGGDGKANSAPAWGITWLDLRLIPVDEFEQLATKR
jgi:hypothetical protein